MHPVTVFIERFRAAVSVFIGPCCPALLELYLRKCAHCCIIGQIKNDDDILCAPENKEDAGCVPNVAICTRLMFSSYQRYLSVGVSKLGCIELILGEPGGKENGNIPLQYC